MEGGIYKELTNENRNGEQARKIKINWKTRESMTKRSSIVQGMKQGKGQEKMESMEDNKKNGKNEVERFLQNHWISSLNEKIFWKLKVLDMIL